MSAGQSPRQKRIRYIPQSADPTNPAEGDTYYSDGTPRAEGLYVYRNGDWVSGGGGDVQTEIFEYLPLINVRCASTGNRSVATELEAGDTVDGITLVAGNLVLLKNQTISSQNGIYVVPASGAASRYSGADTVTELSYASAAVLEGSTQALSTWFQNNLLTDLSDEQSWALEPTTRTWTVPQDKTIIWVQMAGGGGAGGSGGRSTANAGTGGGGSGGAGVNPIEFTIAVTPGEVISMELGRGGRPAAVSNSDFVLAEAGIETSLTCLEGTITVGGGSGGEGGGVATAAPSTPTGSAPGGSVTGEWSIVVPMVLGGAGGRAGFTSGASFFPALPGENGNSSSRANGGTLGGINDRTSAPAGASGGGGGGGGAGLEDGGNAGFGGYNTTTRVSTSGENGGRSAGGGGGGGGWINNSQGNAAGKIGGFGGHGFIRISY